MGLLDQAGQGGPMVPQMAQAAATAGAPPPGAGQPAPGGAPAPGGPPQAGPPQAGPPQAGPPQAAPAPPNPADAQGAPGGVRRVDPGAKAIPGQLPKGVPQEQASPEEQKEYERAMMALSQILYSNDKTANSIVDQVDPNDKVSSTSKVGMLLINQLDKKIQLDTNVVAQVTQDVVERISELAGARHNIEYGGRELQVIMGSVWEGVQEMFGMEQQDAQALMSGVGDGLSDLKGQYEGFLNG